MITGFNTDIEHDGVVYHVQTEDKGLESPLILSLVYVGGAILASKRSPYDDLIAQGFDEAVLSERVSRQHRLICAAIKAGRMEELKQMGSRADTPVVGVDGTESVEAPAVSDDAGFVIVNRDEERLETPAWTPQEEAIQPVVEDEPAPLLPAPTRDAYMVFDSRRKGGEEDEPAEGLCLSLLEEQEFCSGESLQLGVVVTYRSATSEKPVSGVQVSVKILGTTFRPVIVSVKTQKDGVAMIAAEIPRFSSGRAAILLRAVKGEESVEIRRVVRPA